MVNEDLPRAYGDHWAAIYDDLFSSLDPKAVDVLAELAAGRPALELGIGTGRVALPLADRGIRVDGIEASEKMLQKLRSKPGGEKLRVTLGDFANVEAEDTYGLVFVVFSTLYALLSQEDQVRCVRNVASRLTSGGVFLVEAFVFDPQRYDRGQTLRTLASDSSGVRLDAATHDPVSQRISSNQVFVDPDGSTTLRPVRLRYVHPAELDLMAQLAGLELRARWGAWDGSSFSASSSRHVSIFAKA